MILDRGLERLTGHNLAKIKLKESDRVGVVEGPIDLSLEPKDKLSKLSETELLLYQMLVGYEGSMPYLVELADKHKLMGAVGKLVSKHIAKIERDFNEPRKKYRKKLVLIA